MTYAIDESLVAKARELGPLIREHALETQRERRLSRPVIDALNRVRAETGSFTIIQDQKVTDDDWTFAARRWSPSC